MKNKLTDIIEKYGRWVIVVYLATFVFTFVGVFVLLQLGLKESILSAVPSGWGEELRDEYASAGTLVLSYAITKLTQPIRIALTVALVPLLGRRTTA